MSLRKGEIASLRWEDLDGDLLTLRSENAKSGEARTIPCEGELSEVIARRREQRSLKLEGGTVMLCDLIFHRKGKPIREFRKAWRTASRIARVPSRLFHDLETVGRARPRQVGGLPECGDVNLRPSHTVDV